MAGSTVSAQSNLQPHSDDNVERRGSAHSSSSASSAGSSCHHSETSTIRHDTEPYDIFSGRVERLCELLWPPGKSLKTRLSNSNVASRLRANKYLRSLASLRQTPLLERLKGGDYSRITGITLPPSSIEKIHELILRTPRSAEGPNRPDRDVAMLEFVRQRTSIPVPSIVAKDFSCNNPLQQPYVLQQRIPGTDLNTVWDNLSHAQRCSVARKLGSVVQALLAVETPYTGTISVITSDLGSAEAPSITPFELRVMEEKVVDGEHHKSTVNLGVPPAQQTTLEFFEFYIQRWRAHALEGWGEDCNAVQTWDKMSKVVREMNNLGLFPSAPNCLCHVDLHSRNIMVRIRPDDTLEVTAVLDWDEAIFAPKFMACEPPRWLWDDEKFHVDEDDMLPWPYELAGANELPATPEQQELKCIFEEHAGPGYSQLAYREYSRFSRALFRIATLGLNDSMHFRAIERISREWEVLRSNLTRESS